MYLIKLFTQIFPFLAIILSLVFSKTNFYIFYLFIGILLSGVFNSFIKNIISKPIADNFNLTSFFRPDNASNCGLFPNDNNKLNNSNIGMPSGHVQTAGFISTYLLLYLNKFNLLNNVYIILLCLLPLVIIYGRVYESNCHTLSQCIIGLIIGIITGLYYFKIIENYIIYQPLL